MKDSKNEAVRAGRTQRCMGEVIERLVADAREATARAAANPSASCVPP